MALDLDFDIINGVNVGLEYVPAQEEDEYNTIILDLFLLRVLFQWPPANLVE